MRPKLLISAVIVMAAISVALAWRIDPKANLTVQEAKKHDVKVLVKQLETEPNGGVPVEIIQATATSSAPSILDDVTYVLKNNSGKPISAVAVTKKVLYRENGKLYGNLRHSMVDFSFPPDRADAKPFMPNTQISMEASGPMNFGEGTIIESVKLKIEYVQYVGAAPYGAGTEGERRINSHRNGAKKYREYLAKTFSEAGQSLVTVVPLLEEQSYPEELKLSPDENLGADQYRRYLLKTLRTKGAVEVEKALKLKR
jgi:hypothetical protein